MQLNQQYCIYWNFSLYLPHSNPSSRANLLAMGKECLSSVLIHSSTTDLSVIENSMKLTDIEYTQACHGISEELT